MYQELCPALVRFSHQQLWQHRNPRSSNTLITSDYLHTYSADDAETVTPGYALLNLSAGTDIQVKGKKIAELYITADNLLNKAYQNHLSRLKYADKNVVTGRRGVYNMGRNITFKLVVPISM